MPWNGYRGQESDVGDGWDAIENCSLYIKGECRRRLGFGAKVDLSGAVAWSGHELGNYALVGTAAGAILSITESTGSVASLATGLSTAQRPTWASMNGRLYYANGTEIRASDAGTSVRTVGIAAPASAATATPTGSGGVVSAGEHLFRYRYYDSTRNRYSNPSDAVSATVTAGQTVTVGYAASGDATIDKIIIEVTPVGAETYYRAATITNSGSSTSFNSSDDTLIVQVTASRDGEFGHEPPPATYDMIAEHRQRLWLWKRSTGVLLWSRALFPESWDQINYNRQITLDAGDTPVAMASFYSDFYLIGTRSMRRLVYTSDPAAAMIVDVPGNFGCFNPQCLIKIDGGVLFGWGRNGAWIIDAMQPKKISQNVDDVLAALASGTTTHRFMAWEPERREVLYFFPLTGDTYAKAALAYSLETQEWVLYKYRQPVSYGMLHTAYDDRQRLTLHDANGYGWRVGLASNDGGGNGVVTVDSGSSTTVINGTNTATPGQTLYIPSTGEERLITVASASQITVSPALSAAPTAGMKVYVGSIRQRILSDWLAMDSIVEKKRPTKLLIGVRPEGTVGTAEVAYYQDFSSTATPATSFAADTFPEGVSVSAGEIAVDFDAGAADGLVPVPTPADWKRVLRCEIIAETPGDGVRFLEVAFKDDKGIPEDRE